jgi:NAD(P)-dependent dehydrogenase (short-subunit alcohol dehydrogenase family)
MATTATELTATKLWGGSTAVITGAAGGLGAGFAEVAASFGMSVVLIDVDADGLAGVVDRIVATGGRARAVVVDVRDFDQMQALADEVAATDPPIGLLVNNAGIEHVGLLWEEPPSAWHRVIDVNLHGVYHGVRAFVPHLVAGSRDSVVLNISSIGGLTTGGYHATYSVTKHAVLAMSEALADGLKDVGAPVRVAVALPGPINTRIYSVANTEAGEDSALGARLGSLRNMLGGDGMDPHEAAAMMLDQVAAGAFAVTTHPDWLERFGLQRSERIAQMSREPAKFTC